MIAQWLRRWTWNPMRTFRARSSPARSLCSHFSEKYSEEVGNTSLNTCVRKQLRLTNQRLPIFSCRGHVDRSVWKRPAQHDTPQQQNEQKCKKKLVHGRKQTPSKYEKCQQSCDGRVVKALDLKSNGNFPHRFEPCSKRSIFFLRKLFRRIWEHEPKLVFAKNWDWRTKDSQLLFLDRTCRRQRLETTSTTILSKKSKISASKQNVRGRNQIPSKKRLISKRAMIAQWLRRWTWNPMGTSCARWSPARSLRSHFQKNIQKKLGTRTNTFVRKQLRLTNQRHPFTFPGKELYTAAFGDDQHDNPQQKSEQ